MDWLFFLLGALTMFLISCLDSFGSGPEVDITQGYVVGTSFYLMAIYFRLGDKS